MKWNIRFRCALICVGFVTLFSLFSFRLVYIQVIKHDEYAGLAAEKHVHKQIIYAERGAIYDANSEVLAHNVPMQTIVADATRVNSLGPTVDLLSAELNIPRRELMEKIQGDRRYIVVQRQVPDAQAKALLEKLRAQNVAFEELIIPDEIHDLLRWSDWVRSYKATAEFFDRNLAAKPQP